MQIQFVDGEKTSDYMAGVAFREPRGHQIFAYMRPAWHLRSLEDVKNMILRGRRVEKLSFLDLGTFGGAA